MYCGNCLRDNALVAALRKAGHQVTMVPLYLPLTLDERDQSADTPIFFSGISVYLEQKSKHFQNAPAWFHRLLAARALLRWAAGKSASTRAEEVGDITVSMLQGESGNQAREVRELADWLKTQPRADAICVSNALLTGMIPFLKRELRLPVLCWLQGEAPFVNGVPEPFRTDCWRLLGENAREVDLFVAPSRYCLELMSKKLCIPPQKIRLIYNGINLDGYAPVAQEPKVKTIGFFARMCRDKGLDTLVDAFITLRQRNRLGQVRLKIGGSCGPADEPFVAEQKSRLKTAGFLDDVEFHPNLDRDSKIEFLKSLSVLSVPARYGEVFGLYLAEAWAAGIPVVQPRASAFPELIELSGAGLVCEPENPTSLADALESVLTDDAKRQQMSAAALAASRKTFNVETMMRETLSVLEELRKGAATRMVARP